jgi:hypothetical protein
MHFRVKGKRNKIRFVPVHPMVQRLIVEYLAMAKHGGGLDTPDLDALPSCEEQPHGQARQASRSGLDLPERGPQICAGDRHQCGSDRVMRAFAARDGRDECAVERCGYRQGPGMARTRERLHYPPLRFGVKRDLSTARHFM